MNARHRYIVGTWALLACLLFLLLATASWSHFHSSHHELLRISWGCAQTGGYDYKCTPPYRVVTTANRAPAVALWCLASVAGFLAFYCFTAETSELQSSSAATG